MDVSIQNYLNQIKFFKRKGWQTFEIWECVINDKKRLKEEIEKILEISKIHLKIDASNRDIVNNLI